MFKLISKLFSEKAVFPINLLLFVVCILVGLVCYGGKLHGGGDDMNNLAITAGNGSSLEYVKWYYLNWGQTGIVMLVVPIQVAVKIFHIAPEGFPWWFFASINTFCYVAAVYMLVAGGKRLLRYEWHEALFLLFFIYGVWLNPHVYSSTIAIPVTFFVAFALPVYLLTIAIYFFSFSRFGQNRKDWLIIGCIYLLLSINTETFLLSLPIIFTGIVIVRALQEEYGLIRIIRNIGFFAMLSMVSVLFVWSQPGFHTRPLSLNFHIPSFLEIAQWYVRVLDDIGILTLVENHYHLPNPVLFLIPFLLVVIILGLWIWRKSKIRMNSNPKIVFLLSTAIWILILVLGYLFCMVPLLFSGYYPDYVKVYPTLLMAGALGLSLIFFVQLCMSDLLSELLVHVDKPSMKKPPAGYQLYWLWFKWFGIGAVLLGVFSLITVPHFMGIYRAYQVELISSAIRRDFQKTIEVEYYKTGQKDYIVTGCPKGVLVEQFWGISGYFYWKGIDGIFGVLDTDPNLGGSSPEAAWPDKSSWKRINCLQLTSQQLHYLEP